MLVHQRVYCIDVQTHSPMRPGFVIWWTQESWVVCIATLKYPKYETRYIHGILSVIDYICFQAAVAVNVDISQFIGVVAIIIIPIYHHMCYLNYMIYDYIWYICHLYNLSQLQPHVFAKKKTPYVQTCLACFPGKLFYIFGNIYIYILYIYHDNKTTNNYIDIQTYVSLDLCNTYIYTFILPCIIYVVYYCNIYIYIYGPQSIFGI